MQFAIGVVLVDVVWACMYDVVPVCCFMNWGLDFQGGGRCRGSVTITCRNQFKSILLECPASLKLNLQVFNRDGGCLAGKTLAQDFKADCQDPVFSWSAHGSVFTLWMYLTLLFCRPWLSFHPVDVFHIAVLQTGCLAVRTSAQDFKADCQDPNFSWSAHGSVFTLWMYFILLFCRPWLSSHPVDVFHIAVPQTGCLAVRTLAQDFKADCQDAVFSWSGYGSFFTLWMYFILQTMAQFSPCGCISYCCSADRMLGSENFGSRLRSRLSRSCFFLVCPWLSFHPVDVFHIAVLQTMAQFSPCGCISYCCSADNPQD
jgi:hypothetical protein